MIRFPWRRKPVSVIAALPIIAESCNCLVLGKYAMRRCYFPVYSCDYITRVNFDGHELMFASRIQPEIRFRLEDELRSWRQAVWAMDRMISCGFDGLSDEMIASCSMLSMMLSIITDIDHGC